MGNMDSRDSNELVRRLENVLRLGTIDQVDVAGALVRVRCGGLRSTWVRWFTRRAGDVREWCPPSIGEQCLLVSPGGDLANGMALVGAFSDGHPPHDNRAHIDSTLYPDGTLREYDDETHRHLLRCVGDIVQSASGSIRSEAERDITSEAGGLQSLKAAESILIEAGTSITLRVGSTSLSIGSSGMTGTPDIVVDGISLRRHVHDSVRRGSENTGGPVR